MGIGCVTGGNRRECRIALARDDLCTPRCVPCTDQLGNRQVLAQPDPALPQRHGVGKHSADAAQLGAREAHKGVMNRQHHLVGEPQIPVSEGFLEQVVGRGDRADERVLDWENPGLGRAVTNGRDDVLHFAAGNGLEVGPPPASGRLAEGARGSLDCYAHLADSSEEQDKKKPAVFLGGASMGPFWLERQCTLVPEPDGRGAAPVRAK
jgi:hypothetical protein